MHFYRNANEDNPSFISQDGDILRIFQDTEIWRASTVLVHARPAGWPSAYLVWAEGLGRCASALAGASSTHRTMTMHDMASNLSANATPAIRPLIRSTARAGVYCHAFEV